MLSTIPKGEDPVNVPLFDVNFWIQIHGLPSGFMSKAGRQAAREFLWYVSLV